MKKLLLLTAIAALPIGMMAQDDDMYFVPSKANKVKSTAVPTDAAESDIIDFSATKGVYPEGGNAEGGYTEVDGTDYQYTRQMARFDDYTPSDAYWDGFRDGSWASPWYYNSWYGWYDRSWYWDTPWYYGGWGYYRPWGYYGYYGWYGPRYVGGVRTVYRSAPRFHANRRVAVGLRTSGNRGSSRFSNGSFGNGSRSGAARSSSSSSTRSGVFNRSSSTSRSSGSFGSNRSSGSFGSSRSSGSFGGSRSSGGSFGGGRSGGGSGRFGR